LALGVPDVDPCDSLVKATVAFGGSGGRKSGVQPK